MVASEKPHQTAQSRKVTLMLKTTACSLALAMLCSAAVAEDQQQSSQSQSQSQQDRAGTSASGTGASAQAQTAAAKDQAQMDPTQMFVKEAYIANLFEIQAGQLAAQKAQDDKAKQFARMMIEDHTMANQKLKQVAQSANIQISEQLDPVHQAKLQKMQQIPAAEFNRKYINSQVAGHWMNVLEFRHQAQNGQNEQVKQYAAQVLPKLQQHLKHATQMAEQQVGGAAAQPAGARQSGAQDATSGAASDTAGGTSSGASDRSSGQSGQSDSAGQSGQSGQPGQSDTAGQSDAGQSK
jgi:putative membrane protein